ncbi:MAG: thioredoxin-like domain-containing protein, partial [Planctomycetaceae bacterium]
MINESRSTRSPYSRPHRILAAITIVAVLGGGAMVMNQNSPLANNDLLAQAARVPVEQDNEQASAQVQKQRPGQNPFPNLSPAPSLDGGLGWLNVSPGTEINLKDLRGKVVVLDFWTYCCINCMHVLPDLKYLEKKYDKELVVIGVHSAKFDNEKDTEAIRRAILRYEIEHPVINDANMTVWRKFGVSSWPTLALIDPEGKYVGQQPGEGNRELFDKLIGMLVDYHKKKGTLDRSPVRFDLESNRLKSSPLKFPGKVLADHKGGRLFITDTNHNRIVVTGLDGTLKETIGSGAIGRQNGRYADATFDHPQGTVLIGNELYVADTENHMIRIVDLAKKTVRTLAGTGRQARIRSSGGPLRQTALNSPWALAHLKNTLYIAMAGPHQLWSHKLGSTRIEVFAGTGREDITDGPLNQSALAQPSSLTTDGKHLFVADSEGSSIRQVDTSPGGQVTTVVGAHDLPRGQTLFAFGDIDGVGDKARLQHPLGVAFHNGSLYVADSYNHKIKTIDLKTRRATTFLGNGKRGVTV